MVTRGQLLAFGMSPRAITYRLQRGRLHPVFPGVYRVGTPDVSRLGLWMAAVLSAARTPSSAMRTPLRCTA